MTSSSVLTFAADEPVTVKGLSDIAHACGLPPDVLSKQLGIGTAKAKRIEELNEGKIWQHKFKLLLEWRESSKEPTYGYLCKNVTIGFKVISPGLYDTTHPSAESDGSTFAACFVKTFLNEHYAVRKRNDELEKENKDLRTQKRQRGLEDVSDENDLKQQKIDRYFQPRPPLAVVNTNTTPY